MEKKIERWIWLLIIGFLIIAGGAGFGLFTTGYPSEKKFKGLKSEIYEESTEPYSTQPESLEDRVIRAVEKVSPAVVSISTERTIKRRFEFPEEPFFRGPFEEFFRRFFEFPFPEEFKEKGLGSGMIINPEGMILTNEHVLHDVDKDKIKVTLPDGRTLDAELVESDEESDLAVLKVKAKNLPTVILGDSDNLKVGQFVIAIGNPFGFALSQLKKEYEPTVTMGVISATNRSMTAGGGGGRRIYENLIQTDAAINPGNSGGPLVNLKGEVIGINTAILTTSGGSIGIGFAIPVNKAKRIVESLVKYGEVRWPWIGISMQELTPELAKEFGVEKGVLVADVFKNSPAEKAGIKPGDVIQKINGKEVKSPIGLKNEVLKKRIGEKIKITLIRKGKEISLEVITGKRPEKIALRGEKGYRAERMGIVVESITPSLRKRYEIPEREKGVVVVEVEPGSPAREVGITPGDVIISINQIPISGVEDFEQVVKKIKPGGRVLMQIRRGEWARFVVFNLPRE